MVMRIALCVNVSVSHIKTKLNHQNEQLNLLTIVTTLKLMYTMREAQVYGLTRSTTIKHD